MRYRYLDDFRRGISVFAIFSYGIGYPPMSPSIMDLLLLFLPLFNLAESPWKRKETNQFDRITWKRGERVLSKKTEPAPVRP